MGFTFLSYRALKENLGRLDAIVECNELAVRKFISKAEIANDLEAYISDLSELHKVRVNYVEIKALQRQIAQLYILLVYQQAEEFLEGFRDEYPRSNHWSYTDGDDLLTSILKNIGSNFLSNTNSIGKIQVEIFHYYRLVRNRFMHTVIPDRRLDKYLTGVLAFNSEIQKIYNISNAPNDFDNLTFDDFILFSRVIKDIARILCQLGCPTDTELVQMVLEFDKKEMHGVNLNIMKKWINNPVRMRKALSNLVGSLFSLGFSESESVVDGLIDSIMSR